MSSTTMGVRLDEETRNRLKEAAQKLDRTSHWLIKQAIFNYLEQIENNQVNIGNTTFDEQDINEDTETPTNHYQPFLEFAEHIHPQSVLRSAITSAYRMPEIQAVPMLLQQATLPENEAQATHKLAYSIAEKLRKQKRHWAIRARTRSITRVFTFLTRRCSFDVFSGSITAYSR